MLPVRIAHGGREQTLAEAALPLEVEDLCPELDCVSWEVEIGFGKGRFLLAEARRRRKVGFVGIEVASKYYRHVRDRSGDLANLTLLRGEALYLLTCVLPQRFADVVHVYFPDPWPKSRHHGRRLFEAETLDLILRLLRPGGRLLFATDFMDYGRSVVRLLSEHPGLSLGDPGSGWGDQPRTHYEDKYLREGRQIVRLEATLANGVELVHPWAGAGVVAAVARKEDPDEDAAS